MVFYGRKGPESVHKIPKNGICKYPDTDRKGTEQIGNGTRSVPLSWSKMDQDNRDRYNLCKVMTRHVVKSTQSSSSFIRISEFIIKLIM